MLLSKPLWVSLAVDILTSQLTCLSTCWKQNDHKQLARPLIMFTLSQLAISLSLPQHYSQWSWQATQLWRPGAKAYSREWSASPWSGEASKREENHHHIYVRSVRAASGLGVRRPVLAAVTQERSRVRVSSARLTPAPEQPPASSPWAKAPPPTPSGWHLNSIAKCVCTNMQLAIVLIHKKVQLLF